MIWTAGEQTLKHFLDEINTIHNSIKFEANYSKEQIDFLDTSVRITSEKTIMTTLYRKPTDRYAYLHYNAYHPLQQKNNIPYGQYLRVKKICSNTKEAEEATLDVKNKFIKRGYPESILDKQLKKSEDTKREELLQEKPKNRDNKIPFVATFNKTLPNIRQTFDRHWHLLLTNPMIAQNFTNKPILAFRRNKNLRDLIGQTHLAANKKIIKSKKKEGGSSACLSRANNQCCKQVISTKTFSSMETKETFKIFHQLNCRSKNVIYLGYCNKCPNSQYIGKSEPPVNLRINTHRHDVSSQTGLNFDKHFASPGHSYNENARYILIEQVKCSRNT